jgi:hypothetical protein
MRKMEINFKYKLGMTEIIKLENLLIKPYWILSATDSIPFHYIQSPIRKTNEYNMGSYSEEGGKCLNFKHLNNIW